jgi:hypothetical protein
MIQESEILLLAHCPGPVNDGSPFSLTLTAIAIPCYFQLLRLLEISHAVVTVMAPHPEKQKGS